jgi:hypothetical protein
VAASDEKRRFAWKAAPWLTLLLLALTGAARDAASEKAAEHGKPKRPFHPGRLPYRVSVRPATPARGWDTPSHVGLSPHGT